MNTKLIAVAVLATSMGTLVLLNHEDGSAPSFALVGNQQAADVKATNNECGAAADVWSCLTTKRSKEHQKAWDAAHPPAARQREAAEFRDQFSWADEEPVK